MTSEAGDPRKVLERERDRLDGLLEANDAWRALRQLDESEAAERPASAIDPAALGSRIEEALAGVRVYQARRKISEAITLLGAEPAVRAVPDMPPPEQPKAADTSPPPTPAPADDLTLIRGIDGALAARLASAGVDSLAGIAAWRAADVQRVTTALGLDRTIQRQNWIEQAALILARRGARPLDQSQPAATVFGAALASPTVAIPAGVPEPARPVADLITAAVRNILANISPPVLPLGPPAIVSAAPALEAAPAPEPEPALEPEPSPPLTADDLTAVRGLDARAAAALGAAGYTSFAAIARWSTADIVRLRGVLGAGVPLLRAEWIEQAAMLAARQSTLYARSRGSLATLPLAPRPALTAVARDEGLACALRQMWPAAAPAESAPPGAGVDTWGEEIALTSLIDARLVDSVAAPTPVANVAAVMLEAGGGAAPRLTQLSVVVLPPQPAVAPRARPIAFLLPPLSLQTLPEATGAGIEQSPAVVDVAPQGGDDNSGRLEIDYSSDSLLDVAAMNFSEADVQIVAAAPSAFTEDTDYEPRPLVCSGGAGSLQSRLRKASDSDDEFDARGYAAYRSAVEEASVEIVHREAEPHAVSAAPASPQSSPEDGGSTTVRRFLKALNGQGR